MATGVVHHGGQKCMTGLLTYVSISEIFGVCFIVTGRFVDGRSVERTFGRKDVSSTDFCRMDVWSKIVDSYILHNCLSNRPNCCISNNVLRKDKQLIL